MRFTPLFLSIALGILPRASLAAPSILITKDAAGTDCNGLVVPVGSSVTVYVVAHATSQEGCTGAEFRIVGLPAGQYNVTAVPSPASNTSLGDPLGAGCHIGFPDCQPLSGGVVLLYTLMLQNLSDTEGNRILEVTQHATPSDPTYSCPLVKLCDPPLYTPLCTTGSQIAVYVTPDAGMPIDPSPADGANAVPPDVLLRWGGKPSWCCDTGTLDQKLYFGTTPDPPLVADNVSPPYDPGLLNVDTTYYWRVSTFWSGCIDQRSPVWSFTTGTVSVDGDTWARVKQLFRAR